MVESEGCVPVGRRAVNLGAREQSQRQENRRQREPGASLPVLDTDEAKSSAPLTSAAGFRRPWGYTRGALQQRDLWGLLEPLSSSVWSKTTTKKMTVIVEFIVLFESDPLTQRSSLCLPVRIGHSIIFEGTYPQALFVN